jgi:hypothetical protein
LLFQRTMNGQVNSNITSIRISKSNKMSRLEFKFSAARHSAQYFFLGTGNL